MNALEILGVGSIGAVLGGLITHVASRLLDHYLQRKIEGEKHILSVLGNRLDFLHQERGKAAVTLVRLVKAAKMHVKLIVDPVQPGPVDHESACQDAYTAHLKLHNFISHKSFLFPKPLEEQMLMTRDALWSVLSEANLWIKAKHVGESLWDNDKYCQLSKTLKAEFEPLETNLTAEIRSLLAATSE
jgi:hypothetical protein